MLVDEYFNKAQNCCDPDMTATYGVFLRYDSICAVEPALRFLGDHATDVDIKRHFPEGAYVPAEKCLFSYTGVLKDLITLETELLQHVGVPCISAYNAYKMCLALKDADFLDMHARHASGIDMVMLAAYGASVGSQQAKLQGAKGFMGSSLTETAPLYGIEKGLGTMPHVLIGASGSTLEAVKRFVHFNPHERHIVALVDYHGLEVSDALEVAEWFGNESVHWTKGNEKTLGIRLDTHGGRYAERLDYKKSVEIVSDWLHMDGEYSIVRHVSGEAAIDDIPNEVKDRVRDYLFSTGVSAANIINMRQKLDQNGHKNVTITASSGFSLRKCRAMAAVRAPINIVGTGSFLPEAAVQTYATCDAYKYNGTFSVKVGREHIFEGL
jgi:nicotinate phosphoribosyltransferase